MSRFLTPFLLGTAAFGLAWWAGSSRPTDSSDRKTGTDSPASITTPAQPSPPPRADLTGLAKRSAQLLRTENPAVRDIAALLTETGIDSSEMFRLAQLWAESDPAGVWKWLQHDGGQKLPGVNLTNLVFAAWFRLDPAAAMAEMKKVDPENRSTAAQGILSNLTGKNASARKNLTPYLDEVVDASQQDLFFSNKPAESAAILASLPPGKAKDRLTAALGKTWIEKDWKSATAWAATLAEPLKTRTLVPMAEAAFRSVPESMKIFALPSSHNEPECFEWAKQWFSTEATPEVKRRLGVAYVRKLAVSDPAGALAWAQDNLSAQPLSKAMGAVLQEQTTKDPAAARTLVEGLPPGGLKSRVAFDIAGAPSKESAAWLLKEVDNDPNHQWYQYASDWAFKDPEAYRAMLESGVDTKLPKGLAEGGLRNLTARDGGGTMAWAMRTQPPAIVTKVLADWTEQNAPAAVDWVLQRPPGEARDKAVATVKKELGYARIPTSERRVLLDRLNKP